MELGKVWSIKLNSSDETSMIISRLWTINENKEYFCDSICIENWIDVWQGKGDKSQFGGRAYFGERAYTVSLYIARKPVTKNIRESSLTFTKIKRNYSNATYHVDDQCSKWLIQEIYQMIFLNLNLEIGKSVDCQFEKSIIMRAQDWSQRIHDGYGKTSNYYIIGVNLQRFF